MAAQKSPLPTRKSREAVGISVGPGGREIKGRRPCEELQLVEPSKCLPGCTLPTCHSSHAADLGAPCKGFLNLELLLLGQKLVLELLRHGMVRTK
jgi:hypothetical protein